MTTSNGIDLILGLFGAVLTALFKKYVVRLGGIWTTAFLLAVSFGLALGAMALAKQPINVPLLFTTAIVAREAARRILETEPIP